MTIKQFKQGKLSEVSLADIERVRQSRQKEESKGYILIGYALLIIIVTVLGG